MGVITISRECGSDGRTVGQRVAESLGCLYLGKELVGEVARRAEMPVEELERYDEHPEGAATRILKKMLVPAHPEAIYGAGEYGWWPQVPETVVEVPIQSEDDYVRMTQEVMMQLAQESDVVFVGRGSQSLLGFVPGVLHVRLVAPMDFRIRTVVERDGLTEEGARAEIHKVDAERRQYIKRHYGIEWDDPKHYHMVLNTGQFGVERSAALIVDTVLNGNAAQ